MSPQDYLEVAILAAKAGGSLLLDKLGKVGFREKSPADLVTEADFASQKTIEEIVLSRFPDHAFLGEEADDSSHLKEGQCGSGAPADRPLTWIVDPLDGTTNFVHQVPLFCTSIGLASGSNLICGVIYNPVSNECFTAARGAGVWLNGQPIHTRSVEKMSDALISFSFPTQTHRTTPDFVAFYRTLSACQAIRRTGSTALNLAFLAAGRFDAFVGLAGHAWDVAAGVLMVQEAGGIVSGQGGVPFDLATPGVISSASPALQESLLTQIATPCDMDR